MAGGNSLGHPGPPRPELKYEKGQPRTVNMWHWQWHAASASNHHEVPIQASCPRVVTEPDDLRAAPALSTRLKSRPESAFGARDVSCNG